MTTARTDAVAAPLPDGRVLVAGGHIGPPSFSALASAEIFDPDTNAFSSAGIGSMSVPRDGAIAAPLPDGRVLVAGGHHEGGPFGGTYLSSAEVFDPATNTFSSAGIGSMSVTRRGAVAAPLPDGKVLVAGGSFDDNPMYACPWRSAEVFDPSTNTFSSAGVGSMTVGRQNAAAAPLSDGRVLVAGGGFFDLHCGTLPDPDGALIAEAFDPATNTFSRAGIGHTSVPRYSAAAAPLPNGRVLVAGGKDFSSYSALASAEVFVLCSDPSARCRGNSDTCRGNQATIVGSDAADRISGTPGEDVIAGLDGNDKLRGLAGNDVICGGAGRDSLKGGRGKDRLYGDAGKDILKGGRGRDKLKGGAGKDTRIQ